MGTIYRPTYRDRHGAVQTSTIWWARFRQHGRTVRQSTETADERKARAFLREREGKVALNLPVVPQADRLTLAQAAQLILDDYRANGRRSTDSLEIRLGHLAAFFGDGARLGRLTTAHVERYKAHRLAAGAAPASVNRELGALGRMTTLARHQFGLTPPFVITKFEERNVRQGFFEQADVAAVTAHLRPELAALAQAALLTGWRKGELRSRQWPHVDFGAGWLRLEPGETKNGEGRQFPLIPELRALLEAQRARLEAIQRRTGRVVPWVFCRDDGAPVGDFKKAWATACRRAGYFQVVTGKDGRTRKVPTKLVHDFRRSAVRNLVRAGVPEVVAMKLTGHLTPSVFKRYAIVDEGMLQEAGQKLAAAPPAPPRPRGRVAALHG
jgi:integrase